MVVNNMYILYVKEWIIASHINICIEDMIST
jgi:hypothetical protein